MSYIVKAYQPKAITLAPKTIVEEILQNIAMIVSTPTFSIPLDRGFGLAQRFLDKPIQVARAILVSEVLDAIEKYEPRADIIHITFEQSETAGTLIPVVEVHIKNDK